MCGGMEVHGGGDVTRCALVNGGMQIEVEMGVFRF
jgi:hypothetical protein